VAARLLLEVLGPTVPELRFVETALKTVGALRPPCCQRWPIEVGSASAPPRPILWQGCS